MANYTNLKQSVKNAIKNNGRQDITGDGLQAVLLSIIGSVGQYATFAGVADPSTNPGTQDGNVFYIATKSGVYPNFGGLEVKYDSLSIFENSTGSWLKKDISKDNKLVFNVEYTTDVQTTRKSVPISMRKQGLLLSYEIPGYGVITERYKNTSSVEQFWVSDTYWDRIISDEELYSTALVYKNDGFYYCAKVGEIANFNFNDVSNFSSIRIPVKSGEQYAVWCLGGANGRAWALTDKDMRVLSNALANANYLTDCAIIDVTQDGYLLSNHNTGGSNGVVPLLISAKSVMYNKLIAGVGQAENTATISKNFIRPSDLEHGFYNSINFLKDEAWRTFWIPINDIVFDYNGGSPIGKKPYAIKFDLFGSIPSCRFYVVNNGVFSKKDMPDSDTYVIKDGDEKIGFGFALDTAKKNYNILLYKEDDLLRFRYSILLEPPKNAQKKNIYVIGASFADASQWVTMPMQWIPEANIINKGSSGHTAVEFVNDADPLGRSWPSVFTDDMIENCDLLVINFTHNRGNVDDPDMYNKNDAYGALNWMIRKFKELCRAKKDDSGSKWYNNPIGRPCRIAITSNWHDGRTTYTKVYTKVAENWNLPILDWQNNNSFAKHGEYWITGDEEKKWHESVYYTHPKSASPTDYDIEVIDGVSYGWHPNRKDPSIIQNFMGQQFAKLIKDVFGL